MPPDQLTHVGVAAWVVRDNHLLMLRRVGTEGYASDGHGTYSVPGGWLEHHETPEQAVERETLEETGVVVKAIKRLGYTCDPKHEGLLERHSVVTLFIRCLYVSGEPRVTEPDKCAEVDWYRMFDVMHPKTSGMPLFTPVAQWIGEQGMLHDTSVDLFI